MIWDRKAKSDKHLIANGCKEEQNNSKDPLDGFMPEKRNLRVVTDKVYSERFIFLHFFNLDFADMQKITDSMLYGLTAALVHMSCYCITKQTASIPNSARPQPRYESSKLIQNIY